MEHDVSNGRIHYLDIFLTAVSGLLNDNICLMLPDYLWLTEEMYGVDDLRRFQYFLIVDKGHIFYAMKREVMLGRGLSLASKEEDETLLQWMRHPNTGQCKLISIYI